MKVVCCWWPLCFPATWLNKLWRWCSTPRFFQWWRKSIPPEYTSRCNIFPNHFEGMLLRFRLVAVNIPPIKVLPFVNVLRASQNSWCVAPLIVFLLWPIESIVANCERLRFPTTPWKILFVFAGEFGSAQNSSAPNGFYLYSLTWSLTAPSVVALSCGCRPMRLE